MKRIISGSITHLQQKHFKQFKRYDCGKHVNSVVPGSESGAKRFCGQARREALQKLAEKRRGH
jgi:hypothetical protein